MQIDDVLKPMFGSIAIAATVAAFFAQPLFAMADLSALAGGGINIGIGAALLYWEIYEPTVSSPRRWVILTIGVFDLAYGIALAGASLALAAQVADENQVRCAAIQRVMLHPTSRTRTDLPDVFQALGCRPQIL